MVEPILNFEKEIRMRSFFVHFVYGSEGRLRYLDLEESILRTQVHEQWRFLNPLHVLLRERLKRFVVHVDGAEGDDASERLWPLVP